MFFIMAILRAAALHFLSCLFVLLDSETFAKDIYTNIWAVKVRGSVLEAKQLAEKNGFLYDKHVSFFLFTTNITCEGSTLVRLRA